MFKERIFFPSSRPRLELPDLIEIQKTSYFLFLKKGLKQLIEEFSPIKDSVGRNFELHFLNCSLSAPKFDEITSKDRNLTYEAPLMVKARLVNKKTGKKVDQEVYFGDIPLMTKRGTFIINGIERVVVQQLIRSPGAFFSAELIKGRFFYGAKIIPDRGAWLEFETDTRNVIWVRIDRQRKTPVSSLLRIFGLSSDKEILDAFLHHKLPEQGIEYIKSTIEKDPSSSEEEGLIEIYRKIRPGDLATADNAKSLIYSMFFLQNRYDLSNVGRYKLNQRLNFDQKINSQVLRLEDIVGTVAEIIKLNVSQNKPDDIDHLSNRRIRAVGELAQNRIRVGMLRVQRIVKDRMSVVEEKTAKPGQLINVRPIIGVIKEFFMSSQLSQFMDQTNILSELEHKRRVTVVGPGGLTRERAGFEVRDVHRTYYGKICPIATPEGPNVGLVNQLACYARINEYGFIETPYIQVKNGKLTNKIVYLNAHEEEQNILAPFSIEIKNNKIVKEKVEVRINGRPGFSRAKNVDFIDVGANQVVSISTSLIPFLEHDDGVRALMGSNMQRQAVPLIKSQSPIVGTGIESKVARDSGHLVMTDQAGKIIEVDSSHVTLSLNNGKKKTYNLKKYQRSNFDTCFNQSPVVVKNQKVAKNDILIQSSSTEYGELALGQNVLVAFMSWEGGNYEDAVLLSSSLVQDDKLSSLHIDEHVVDIRETKFGAETTTCDIPNVSEEKLKNLDEEGIIMLGAEVKSGDILVGKITPKGEDELSAEEKLLRAIFGEKARDVRDSSLYLEHGEHGKIIDVKIFSREKGDKLAPGVIKSIHVLVADLRKIQVGDKIAGRHGNKGVISRIVSREDMPHLKDGTPVDIILNPLGVVSRMNLGQILETHLGLAAKKLGYRVATPVLNGIKEQEIKQELIKAGYPESGKITLYDGRTGEKFQNPTTVGYTYIMKLNHLVEDKIHQRSIGPYSLITQQPLGGKAQFGGQRFGEMEVWALEGYGAAHTLQELLTIKSDDVTGRTKAYESIIKGKPVKDVFIPESFSVLVRELKGLGLSVEMIKAGRKLRTDKTNNKPNK